MTTVQEPQIVQLAREDESIRLSVREVMENGGEYCGAEWGWSMLGDLLAHGFGFDTEPEVWTVLAVNRPELLRQMKAYLAAHPQLAAAGNFFDSSRLGR